MHISRIAEELIIWNSDGFNLVTLSDKVVTGSSIMPQKKKSRSVRIFKRKNWINIWEFIFNVNYTKGPSHILL